MPKLSLALSLCALLLAGCGTTATDAPGDVVDLDGLDSNDVSLDGLQTDTVDVAGADALATDAADTPDTVDAATPDVTDVTEADGADAPDVAAPDADDAVAIDAADGATSTVDAGCASNAACDDGLACTTDSCGLDGVCLHTADDAACADGNVCTLDTCVPLAGGCTHTATEGTCDDGDDCTSDACSNGACVGTPSNCAGTVCGNGIVEKGEQCDHGALNGPCCDPVSCHITANAPAESEPNASKGGTIYGAAIQASAAKANPLCSSITGKLSPDMLAADADADFFQIYVPAASTLKVTTSDPTGGTACIRSQSGANTYTVGLDTTVVVYDSSFQMVTFNGDIDPVVQDGSNACSAVSLDVADAGIFYVQVQGFGMTAAGKGFAPDYKLDVATPAWQCGDGKLNPNEICDTVVTNNFTCPGLGYLGGTLGCSKSCGFDTSACIGAPAGVEPNDDFSTATSGGATNGGQFIGGVDYFKIWVDAGSTITAQTIDPSGKNACTQVTKQSGMMDLDTVLTVFGPDQVQFASNDNLAPAASATAPGANFCSAVQVSAPVSGYYYFKVSGTSLLTFKDNNGVPHAYGYELDVSITPWSCTATATAPCETLGNDATATATTLVTDVQAAILPVGDVDTFSFTVADTGTLVQLAVRDDVMGGCAAGWIDSTLTLYRADGLQLAMSDDISAQNHCSAIQTTLEQGTYYVQVASKQPGAFQYSLHLGRGVTQLVEAAQGAVLTLPVGSVAAGATLTIPANALASDTVITVFDGAPVAFAAGAPAGPAVQFGPSGLHFDAPVTVTLPQATTSTDPLLVLHRDDLTGNVELLVPSDTAVPGQLSVQLRSFSTVQPATVAVPVVAWDSTEFRESLLGDNQIAKPIGLTVLNGSFAPSIANGETSPNYGTQDAYGQPLGNCDGMPAFVQWPKCTKTSATTATFTFVLDPYSQGAASSLKNLHCGLTQAFQLADGTAIPPIVDKLGNPVATKQVLQALRTDVALTMLDDSDATLVPATFTQSTAGDGNIGNTILIQLTNLELAGAVGTYLSPKVEYGAPRVALADGTPLSYDSNFDGLTPKLKILGPKKLEFSLQGTKTGAIPTSGTVPFTVSFIQSDFKGGTLVNYYTKNVTLDWQFRKLNYSRYVFNEDTNANDGSIVTTSTLTLVNDTFTAAVGTEIGGFANVPAGLTAKLVVTSPTTATLSFTGKATDPGNPKPNVAIQSVARHQIVSLKFADSDFAGGAAANVQGANRDDLQLVFFYYPGFVYTGLPGGNNTDMQAYDFGVGPRHLYWQPMLAENGLWENYANSNPCAMGPGQCGLLNFSEDDTFAFALRSGANPHGAVQAIDGPTGCSQTPGLAFDSNCTWDKWYPLQLHTVLRTVGKGAFSANGNFWPSGSFLPLGYKIAPNPQFTGTVHMELVKSFCEDLFTACCGFDPPYWIQYDAGWGKGLNDVSPYGKWPTDPIYANAPWVPETGAGWELEYHPLVGGPTDKYTANWYATTMQINIEQDIVCPDVRLVNGKRVDLCDGATYTIVGGKFHSAVKLITASKAFTEDCPPSMSCEAKFKPGVDETECYGGNIDATGYPRFY